VTRGRTAAPPARVAARLSDALAAVAGAAGFLTYAFDGFLVGPPVMNGSARGTALMILVAGAPALFVCGRAARRGSVRALLLWAGAAMFLTYNAFMLLFATPLNRLFLLYVAMFGLSLATMIAIAATTDVAGVARRFDAALPARGFAAYLWAIVALNGLTWLGRIVPATATDSMGDLLEGTGLATVPTYVQDLAFWLPLLATGAWLLWRRRPWGIFVSGAGLAFWTVEAATIAVDQWFGHRADPASDVASNAVVVPFAILAAVGAAVLWWFLRHVGGSSESSSR
jgi:hypothetical protein